MSRAQWIEREQIRRMIGDVPVPLRVSQLSRIEVMALSRNWQLDESYLPVFYRLDAAEAEMVHRKILETCGPIYKTLKTAILFPVAGILFVGSP